MLKFTQDWFTQGIPAIEEALSRFKGKDNLVMLEIGSYEGRSTLWFLDNILTGKNCGIFCVDSFVGSRMEQENNYYTQDIKSRLEFNLAPHRGKFTILAGDSQDIMYSQNFKDEIDIAYVDGSHRADDTMYDMLSSFRALKSGGVMLIDDYLWNFNKYPATEVPKTAIDAFLNIFHDATEVIGVTNKIVALRKK